MYREGIGGDRVAPGDSSPSRAVARRGARWLEVGGPRYSRGRHRPKRADRWRWHELVGLALGMFGLALGAGLAVSPAPTAIGLTASGYQVGSLVLPPQGNGLYEDGAVVLLASAHGQAVAAADGYLGQAAFSGVCRVAGSTEECSFTLAGRAFTSSDVLSGRPGSLVWLRRYSTGTRVSIPLLGVAVPAPFPLGSPNT